MAAHPLDQEFSSRAASKAASGRHPARADLSEDNYSPDAFYIRSTDGRGHGEKMSLTIPPEILGRIQSMLESGKFPYRTTHDFVRDAILHRLHALNDIAMNPVITEFLNQQRFLHVLEQQRMMTQQAREVVKLATEQFEAARSAEDWQMLCDGLIAAHQTMDGMREPYRSQMRGELAKWSVQLPKAYRIELVEAGVTLMEGLQ